MTKFKFTKTTLDKLTAQERDYIAWDTELPGFGCKVTPAGRKVFIVQYRMGGRGSPVRKLTLGPFGTITLQQAREQATKALGKRAEGIDPQAEKRDMRQKIGQDRVRDLVATFLVKHAANNRSASETKRIFDRNVLPVIGSRSVHEVRKRDIIDILHKVEERGAATMANRVLAAVRKFFNWLVSRAILETSPCNGIGAPSKENSRDRCLTDDELSAILKAAQATPFPYGPIVLLLAHTGQRREEVAGLRRREINTAHAIWQLPATRAKNGKPHDVHLTKPTLDIIAGCTPVGELVLSLSAAKPFQGWSKSKSLLDKTANVHSWRLHDLRRTMVTYMARIGVAQHVSDRILNHKSGVISGVAAVYQQHEFHEERKQALEKWSAHLVALALREDATS